MSFARDLLTGLATTLGAAGAGTYRDPVSGGAYLPGETAVTFGNQLPTPDRCITLTGYGAGFDAPREALSQTNVQALIRGNPGDYLDLVDLDAAVFNALHGLSGQSFGSVWLIQCLAKSAVPLGQDASKRWEMTHNFTLDINPPTTALRPE